MWGFSYEGAFASPKILKDLKTVFSKPPKAGTLGANFLKDIGKIIAFGFKIDFKTLALARDLPYFFRLYAEPMLLSNKTDR